MAEPIPPTMAINTVVCQLISIHYNQTWDGAAWVITPATIEVKSTGILANDGVGAASSEIFLLATDLPAAGQTALQELLGYIEDEMVVKYS